jgi:hypothetical protein
MRRVSVMTPVKVWSPVLKYAIARSATGETALINAKDASKVMKRNRTIQSQAL